MLSLDIVMAILMAVTLVYGLYFVVIAVLGSVRKEKRCPPAPPIKRIAAIIAARNESGVIAQLVKSILAQHYPAALRDVFVVPNNCTDDTERAALEAGARIFHCPTPVHSKGEAVSLTIDALLAYPEHYDGFIIVDADNLLDPDYFQKANDALCAGAKVGQGFRDSKNYADSWIAGCSAEFYWCMSRFFNRARNALGMSATLNGTGILLSAEYMREVGWHTSSLTEDLEFSAQCALNGVSIWWLGDAVAYDEQPNRFSDSFKQRRRWAAGTVQCMRMYWVPLIKRALSKHSLHCLDMAILFAGQVMQLVSLIPGAYFMARTLTAAWSISPHTMYLAAAGMLAGCAIGYILISAGAFWVFRLEGRSVKGQLSTVFGLWLFLLSWIPANLLSLLTRPPKWVQIPHERPMSVEDVVRLAQNGGKYRSEAASKRSKGWDEPV